MKFLDIKSRTKVLINRCNPTLCSFAVEINHLRKKIITVVEKLPKFGPNPRFDAAKKNQEILIRFKDSIRIKEKNAVEKDPKVLLNFRNNNFQGTIFSSENNNWTKRSQNDLLWVIGCGKI